MSRLAITVLFLTSLAICLSVWVIFDSLFVRPQNRLFDRLEARKTIHQSANTAQGGRLRVFIWAAWRAMSGMQGRALGRSERKQLFELPDLIELMSVSMSSGDGIFTAISKIASRANGVVAQDLKRLVLAVEMGATLPQQLDAWAKRAQSRHVSELCTKLQVALVRGTPLAEMLTELSKSLRSEVQQVLSKQAGQNETRMLVPLIFLILPVTVIFAIYPSLQVLSITQ